jgi:hypothetical protein
MQVDAFSGICAQTYDSIESMAQRLARQLLGICGAEQLPALAKSLVDRSVPLPELPFSAPVDKEYVENLGILRDMIDWRAFRFRPETARRRLRSSQTHELLVPLEPVFDWSPVILFIHAALAQVRPSKRAAVVVSMRDEGISVLEWVAHYRAIGFSEIFVYTNDNVDGSDQLLGLLADHGVITLIDNITSKTVFPHIKAFAHSLHFVPELRDYEWVAYVDADELLVPAEEFDWSIVNVLHAVEKRYRERPPSALCYHWRWFISNYAIARIKGLLLERFQHALPQSTFKSVVRIADVLSMRQNHMPEVTTGGYFVDSALDVIPQSLGLASYKEGVWNYSGNGYHGGQLNHYWCKSFEEFLVKKRRSEGWPEPSHRREMELFFNWNAAFRTENTAPPPPRLLQRVKSEMRELRALRGVEALEFDLDHRFRALVDNIAGPDGVTALYDHLARGHGTR